ncbi:MAG: ABC transporter permease [Deltaproteobacteria bacterium]|nr:ABC transporter permease [Deltaproteobacteria bacterium]
MFRKELADHFGSSRFLATLSLIFMCSFLSAHMAGQGVRALLAEGGGVWLEGRTFLLLFTAPGGFFSLSVFLALFGPLVGVVLGFDSVNRERSQGTLSKILAQPIRRDEFILAKFLAGLTVLAVTLTALTLVLIGLGLMGVGVVPTVEEVLRLGVFWLVSLVYLGFWLGVAMLASIVFRSAGGSAMASAALWIFLTFFLPVLGQAAAAAWAPFADPSRPQVEELEKLGRANRLASLVSPASLYDEASAALLDPTRRGADQTFRLAAMSRVDQYLLRRFQGLLPLPQSLIMAMPDFLMLLGFSAAAFVLSYLTFVRQEVRSA